MLLLLLGAELQGCPCSSRNCNHPLVFILLGDQYALKMRFVDHVFDEQVTDSLTVKIVLPEGAK